MLEYFVIIVTIQSFPFTLPKHSWVGKSKDNKIALPSRRKVVDPTSRGGRAHPSIQSAVSAVAMCALYSAAFVKTYTERSEISTHGWTFVLTTADIWSLSYWLYRAIDSQKATLLYKDSSMVYSGNKGLIKF